MDLLSTVRKSGSRGGVNFSWDDVAASSHRENYLGHSLKAPVGRWQKGRDLNWYAKADDDSGNPAGEGTASGDTETPEERAARERRDEIRRVKEAEEDAISRMLGLPVAPRNTTGANAVEVSGLRVSSVTAGAGPSAEARTAPSNNATRRDGRDGRGDSRRDGRRSERAREPDHREHRHHHRRRESKERGRRRSRSRSRSRSRDREGDRRRDYEGRRGRERASPRERRRSRSRERPPTRVRRDGGGSRTRAEEGRHGRYRSRSHSRSRSRGGGRHEAGHHGRRRSASPLNDREDRRR